MIHCPSCEVKNDDDSDNCIACGKGLYALTRGSIVSGRYEILDSIGKGGMGVVYKAHDRELDEVVALKVMRGNLSGSTEGARRFRSEIKLARKVTNHNVCRIHDYGREGHLTYIVMEFLAGTDLKQEVRQRGAFAPAEALDLILQVARGLEAVHRQGVVHRDLKTPNIMRLADGTAKLMDFGIAKSFAADAGSGATATGSIVGTPEYMSPEQARAEAVDARSDIYALGIVLFELLTGELPFRGETPVATLFKHMQDAPPLEGPRAARIPAPVIPVLRRALAKSAGDRYATVHEMAAELERARTLLGPAEASPPAPALSRTAATAVVASFPTTGPLATVPLPARDLDVTTPMPTPVPTLTPTSVPTPVRTPVPTPVPPRAEAAAVPAVTKRPARPPAPRPAPARALPPPRQPSARSVPWIPWAAGALAAALAVVGWLVMSRPEAALETTASEPPLSPSPPATAAVAAPTTLPAPTSPSVAASSAEARVSAPLISTTLPAAPRPVISSSPARPTPTAHARPLPTAPPAALATKAYPSPAPIEAAPKASPSTAPLAANAPSPPAPVDAAGNLRIGVKPYAEVFVDGKSVGTTPLGVLTLPAGSYTVRLVHPDFLPLQRKVTIRPAESVRLTIDLALDGIPK